MHHRTKEVLDTELKHNREMLESYLNFPRPRIGKQKLILTKPTARACPDDEKIDTGGDELLAPRQGAPSTMSVPALARASAVT